MSVCTKLHGMCKAGTTRSQGLLCDIIRGTALWLTVGLAQDTSSKLNWMRETAMVIDPEDEVYAPHMRSVLQAVFGRLKEVGPTLQGRDVSTCRTVTHLVNALLHRLAY